MKRYMDPDVISTVLTSAGWLYIANRVWVGRRDPYLAGRIPILVCVISFGCLGFVLAVILHWIALSEDREIPCSVLFWPACTSVATVHIPHLLRIVRLVVVLNKTYRGKCARFVKLKNIVRMWAVISLAVLALATVFFIILPDHSSRNTDGCYVFDGKVLSIGASIWLATIYALNRKLFKVKDAFNIKREAVISSAGAALFISPIVVILLLLDVGKISHTRAWNRAVELLYAAALLHIFVWSTLIPVATHHRWRLPGGVKVVPAQSEDSATALTEAYETLAYIREAYTTVGILFRDFCRQHMCMENWAFAVEAVVYENVTRPLAQYNAFCEILDEFLQPSSPQEINISGKLQARMLSLRKREVFLALDSDAKSAVLEEPLREVIMLLENNLLPKFSKSLKLLKIRAFEKQKVRRASIMERSQRLTRWGSMQVIAIDSTSAKVTESIRTGDSC